MNLLINEKPKTAYFSGFRVGDTHMLPLETIYRVHIKELFIFFKTAKNQFTLRMISFCLRSVKSF